MPDLLIEIGTEEIPASYSEPALAAFEAALTSACGKARLTLPEARRLGTPRRLTLHFASVAEMSESLTVERMGPAAKIGFDADGNPTKAALGFARGQSVDPSELRVVETKKGPYVAVTVREEGVPAGEIVAAALPGALRSIPFPKVMRWTGSDLSFARPIRGLAVVFGDVPVDLTVAGVRSSGDVPGHPFLSEGRLALESADLASYRQGLIDRRVVADPKERRERILAGLAGHLDERQLADVHEGLLDEVTWLAEWPVVVQGRIDEEFLELPVEVLETAMRVHLRFFPVLDADGRPEARFLAVMNRTQASAPTVTEGFERVLRSRLSDARFFLAEDAKRTLEEMVPELGDKALHRELGSYLEKVGRLEDLSAWLAEKNGLAGECEAVVRAARLAKADLVTEMVGEFPELQGTIGRIYALRDGESPQVATAVEDHYQPRGQSGWLPRGRVAQVVAAAEKLDNLVAFFSVGGPPSGSSDPFGLRRQALGLLRLAAEGEIQIPLAAAIRRAIRVLGVEDAGALEAEVLGFVRDRLYRATLDEGRRYDLVRAALGAGFDDVRDFHLRVRALHAVAGEDWWPRLVEVVERTGNILQGAARADTVETGLLEDGDERELHDALLKSAPGIEALIAAQEYAGAARAFSDAFSDVVHAFFANVYVNVEDERVRANRMALLGRVNDLFAERVADLSDVGKE